jgi:hypothetical protein
VAPECSRKLISGLNDAERDAKPAKQPGHARATDPKKAPRSRYRIDPEAIAAGRLPETVPVVTSATNPHYQKYFDRLFGLAKAGDWDAVCDYRITGSNSYSNVESFYPLARARHRYSGSSRAKDFCGDSIVGCAKLGSHAAR